MSYFERRLRAQAHALKLPEELKESVDRYVGHLRPGGPDSEQAPFPRRVDLWAYSGFVAIALGRKPVDAARVSRARKFRDTGVAMSPELCELLAVAAAAGLGPEHDGVTEPAEIINYANRLAFAGCPVVIAELEKVDLRLTPLEKMARHAESLLRKVHGP